MSVNLSTVQKWVTELDHLGEWLHYDESGGKVMRFFCVRCALNTKTGCTLSGILALPL